MKNKLLILIGIITLSLVVPSAFGIPFFSEEQKIEVGQFIAIGKITSYHDEGIYRFYDAKIIKWLKNPIEQDTVSFRGINEKGFEPHTPKAIFEVGDYAVINLRDYDRGFLESTFFSNKISEDQIESEIKRIEDLVELKIPLPLDIRKSTWNSCSSLGDGFSKEEKYFWETLHIKLLSITTEFKSANGKLSSITIQSEISATSCPPTTNMNGTFTSVNEEMHKFQLEFDGNTFRYQIDDIFPPQYEGAMESPLKQFKSGIKASNIQCKNNLILIQKHDGTPACVKPETKMKLIERGWAAGYSTKTSETTDKIRGVIDKEVGYMGLKLLLPYVEADEEPIAISLEGPQNEIEAIIESYDITIMSTKKSQDQSYSANFGKIAKKDLQKFFTENPLDEFTSKGLQIASLGGYTDDAGTFGPFNEFLTEEENNEIGQTLKEYENKRLYDLSNIEQNQTEQIGSTGAIQSLIDANNQFALKFYSQAAQDSNENIFFSPWSISTAFSLAYEGARGDTAQEISSVFEFPQDDNLRRSLFQQIQNDLNAEDADYSLNTANALWIKEGYEIKQDYIDTAKVYYDSQVDTVDFVSDEGVNTINEWVRSKTQNKIEQLLEPGSTDELTRLVITNAIYFKGEWMYPFSPSWTKEADFHVSPDKTVKVSMMDLDDRKLNYVQNDLLEILELPYKGEKVSMLILLPKEIDGLKSLEENLTAEKLSQWRKNLSETQIAVFLPKFTAETKYNLTDSLQNMGMKIPFDKFNADFSGINDTEQLYIDEAVHKAFVNVYELGTEAAAATGVEMRNVSGPPATFRADHPFIFVIQDNETGQILFMGRMTDPTI